MAYFITKAEVIAQAFFRPDIEEDKIQDNLIEACGIRYLKPILGEDFYDDVVDDPASYVDLKVELLPVLANYVKFEILPEIHTETSTAGLNQFTGQNKRAATQNDLEKLRQAALDEAHKFAGKLHKHLEDNTDTYTLYNPNANPQNNVIIAGGIIFDDIKDVNNDDYTQNTRYL